jgi:hypothetical protein
MKRIVLYKLYKLGHCLPLDNLCHMYRELFFWNCLAVAYVAQHVGIWFMVMRVALFTILEQGKALMFLKWLQHLRSLTKWCTYILNFLDFPCAIEANGNP